MAHFRPIPRKVPVTLVALFFCAVTSIELHAQVPRSTPQPSLNGAAQLLSFTGQISFLKDGNPWALNVGDTVQPLQIIVTGDDGYGVFKVADGSTFEVFPKSRVVFRANRGDWQDLLELWLGKVRVQIEHFGGLPNPNKVHTPSAVISVRGTVFDVEVEDGTETTFVIDEEGSVDVRHLLRPGPEKILTAGQSVVVYKDSPLAKTIDKGALMQRVAKAASDALYQAAVNASRAAGGVPGGTTTGGTTGGTVGGTTGGVGDKNNGGTPPPPPPPPPPPTGK